MGTEVEKQQGGDVVSVADELAMEAQTRAALERPTGAAISLRAGVISWQGQPVAGNRLKGVIIDSTYENRLYTKPFNADIITPPDCFALAREESDLAPHEDAITPFGLYGKCLGCKYSQWGSDPRGGRGKACGNIRRLALIPETALVNEKTIRDAEVAILKTPVTSTRYWSAYVNRLSAAERRPAFSVVTEIYTEPHPKHQFHLYYNMVRFVPDELLPALRQKILLVESTLFAPYPKETQQATQAPAEASKKY